MSTFNVHDVPMSATKGVQRRSRVAQRDDLDMARWWIPKDLRQAAKNAAKESGLSESLYVERLLETIASQNGSLPRFDIGTADHRQEPPIARIA